MLNLQSVAVFRFTAEKVDLDEGVVISISIIRDGDFDGLVVRVTAATGYTIAFMV